MGPGVEPHALNERRFDLAFEIDLPQPAEVDPSKVNSILRPTLPTTPWYKPRTAVPLLME